MPKIIDNHDRTRLQEGRNTGMAFAFLKKNDDSFETIQPLSPCKDYLNEVVFTENTEVPTRAYGLDYPKKNNIFEDKCYLAVKIVPNKQNMYVYSNSIDTDKQHLRDNHKNIESFIHYFEERLGINDRTIIEETENDYFLVTAPLEWRNSTISISLYTLLLRLALVYDKTIEPMTYLDKYSYNKQDIDLLNGTRSKITQILKNGKLPEQPETHLKYAKEKGAFCPHEHGIMSYNEIAIKETS